MNELHSIVSYGAVNPALSPAFNTGCVPGCTVLTCSCTVPYYFWSSSTYQFSPWAVWTVWFYNGTVDVHFKTGSSANVRAVRGGS